MSICNNSLRVSKWLSRDPLGEGWDATLYSYSDNNPISLNDPLGLYAQVTVNGNNVNIVLPIDFHQGTPVNGPNGATIQPGTVDPALVQQIINNIEKSWTGKFGKYNVTTTVTTPGSNCPSNKKNNWNILNNPPPDMPAFAPDGNTEDMPNNRASAAGHEAGHLMDNGSNYGLPDPPDPNNTGLPNYPGIMGGNNSASPTGSDISNVISLTR